MRESTPTKYVVIGKLDDRYILGSTDGQVSAATPELIEDHPELLQDGAPLLSASNANRLILMDEQGVEAEVVEMQPFAVDDLYFRAAYSKVHNTWFIRYSDVEKLRLPLAK